MKIDDIAPVLEELKTATSQRLDDMSTKQGELMAQVQELAQRSARRGGPDPVETKNAIVDTLKNAPALNDFKSGLSNRARIALPAGALSMKAVTLEAAGVATPTMFVPQIYGFAQRRVFVRDLIPSIPVTVGAVTWLRETSFNNNAAIAAENTTKPQSDVTESLQTTPVVVIAHWMRATKQLLDDLPTFVDYLSNRLRYGLALEEDQQLLNGTSSIGGIIPQAAAATGGASGDTKLDTLARAIEQLQVAEYVPDSVMINPADWLGIRLLKDSQGRYIFGAPDDPAPPSVWNLPLVVTNAIASGHFLVGSMALGATLLDRQQAVVEISTEDQDNFVKNLVTIRAEERLGLVVTAPNAFVTGTFA